MVMKYETANVHIWAVRGSFLSHSLYIKILSIMSINVFSSEAKHCSSPAPMDTLGKKVLILIDGICETALE